MNEPSNMRCKATYYGRTTNKRTITGVTTSVRTGTTEYQMFLPVSSSRTAVFYDQLAILVLGGWLVCLFLLFLPRRPPLLLSLPLQLHPTHLPLQPLPTRLPLKIQPGHL